MVIMVLPWSLTVANSLAIQALPCRSLMVYVDDAQRPFGLITYVLGISAT